MQQAISMVQFIDVHAGHLSSKNLHQVARGNVNNPSGLHHEGIRDDWHWFHGKLRPPEPLINKFPCCKHVAGGGAEVTCFCLIIKRYLNGILLTENINTVLKSYDNFILLITFYTWVS